MRSRVTSASREAANQIWMGTFHAFGLELLRKYGFKIGISPDFAVLDPVDAIFLLEEKLQSLNLSLYQNLNEPTLYFPDILAAISRAKDELVDSAHYMTFANGMISSAGDDEKNVWLVRKRLRWRMSIKFTRNTLKRNLSLILAILFFGRLFYSVTTKM